LFIKTQVVSLRFPGVIQDQIAAEFELKRQRKIAVTAEVAGSSPVPPARMPDLYSRKVNKSRHFRTQRQPETFAGRPEHKSEMPVIRPQERLMTRILGTNAGRQSERAYRLAISQQAPQAQRTRQRSGFEWQ
jgi:hypothetical protein